MTLTEYQKNLIWPLCIFAMITINLYIDPDDKTWWVVWYMSIFNTFLYPFSKKMVETIALKFTTKEHWHRGIWYDTPAKNPVYAIYYLFCYFIAIPASAAYLFLKRYNKKGQ